MQYLRLFSPGRLILIATLGVAAYLLVSAGGNIMHSYRLAEDEAKLRQEVEQLEVEQSLLEQVRDYLRTDEYVEFMARRIFGLVKPGEHLVIVSSPDSGQEEPASGAGESWWERLFGGSE